MRISKYTKSYKETKIDISAVSDDELFPDRREKMKVALSPELQISGSSDCNVNFIFMK